MTFIPRTPHKKTQLPESSRLVPFPLIKALKRSYHRHNTHLGVNQSSRLPSSWATSVLSAIGCLHPRRPSTQYPAGPSRRVAARYVPPLHAGPRGHGRPANSGQGQTRSLANFNLVGEARASGEELPYVCTVLGIIYAPNGSAQIANTPAKFSKLIEARKKGTCW